MSANGATCQLVGRAAGRSDVLGKTLRWHSHTGWVGSLWTYRWKLARCWVKETLRQRQPLQPIVICYKQEQNSFYSTANYTGLTVHIWCVYCSYQLHAQLAKIDFINDITVFYNTFFFSTPNNKDTALYYIAFRKPFLPSYVMLL